MLAADPDIAGTANWIGGRLWRFVWVLALLDDACEQAVEVGIVKAQQIEIEVFVFQRRQFCRQHLIVPARLAGDLVVGNHQRAPLCRRQVRKNNHRRFGQSEFTGRHHAAMTGNDDAVSTNQHRVHKAELGDRASDLRHLGFRMCAGVARVRDQPGKRPALDRVGKRHRHLVLVLRGDRAPGGNQAGNLGGNCTGRVTSVGCAINGRLPGPIGISGRW